MKPCLFLLVPALMATPSLLTGQPTSPPAQPVTAAHHPDHPAETRENLLEIVHHLYLWYYDQSFFPAGQELNELEVHFRTVERPLDAGDNSQFGELYFPAIELLVELKRSDYHITEINHPVRDAFFKIRRVQRAAAPPAPLADYRTTVLLRDELKEWFSTKSHAAPPLADQLRAQIRKTLLKHQFDKDWDDQAVHIFYTAPLSPVSNDIWILHENTNQLLQFSADMDVSQSATWENLSLRLKFHQLDPNLILTPDRERTEANELNKDFIGRVLFNCVVLGHRIEVLPDAVQQFHDQKAAAAVAEED